MAHAEQFEPPPVVAPQMATGKNRATYRQLLSDPSFARFFAGQLVSSLGDWIGLIAILAVTNRIYRNEFAVAAVLLARLAPSLFFGPVAGVIVDRWDRKKVMVLCDLGRAALIATLPFVETLGSIVPGVSPVVVLLMVSAALEMLTLLWQPAKDASLPGMVSRHRLTHAYSLLLLAAYATFPISGAAFGLLAQVSRWIASSFEVRTLELNQEHLALFLDSFTFLVSAVLTLTLTVPRRSAGPPRTLNFKEVMRDLIDGLQRMFRHPLIRPWVIGIAGTFAGIGVFISIGLFFVTRVLGGGGASFGVLIVAVGVGLGTGFIAAGIVTRFVPKDVLFSIVVMSLGLALIFFGSVSTLAGASVGAAIAGLFAGFAYPTGYALMQETIEEDFRGRMSAAVNSLMRLAVVGAAALSPALVKLVDQILGERQWEVLGQNVDLRGVRVVIWLGGVSIFVAGMVTTRAISAGQRRRALGDRGLFIAFEGGEGTGKTTQMELLREYLVSRGLKVCPTHEPGATRVGGDIRNILLDPANAELAPETEALLYAADRAQHVNQVIRPALESGQIVISDRFVDSSVAYQGLARGLGGSEISNINRLATGGLLPDLVILLDYEPRLGLERAGHTDRIEQESVDFHEKVRAAYRALAAREADRFVIVDASGPAEEVAAQIRAAIDPLLERHRESQTPTQDQS